MNLISIIKRGLLRKLAYKEIGDLLVIVIGDKDSEDQHLLDLVLEALLMIETYDFTRYQYILRDIKCILVTPLLGSLGRFKPKSSTCYLDSRLIKELSTDTIASVIVHEATHARPCLRKVGYPEALRYRVERICARQEIMFAEKLPNGTEVRERAERYLALAPPLFSDENIMKKRLEGGLATARHYGWPEWPIKLAHAVGQMRQRFRIRSKKL